nr:hypothetical protein CFP56_33713 [Quercus suber]
MPSPAEDDGMLPGAADLPLPLPHLTYPALRAPDGVYNVQGMQSRRSRGHASFQPHTCGIATQPDVVAPPTDPLPAGPLPEPSYAGRYAPRPPFPLSRSCHRGLTYARSRVDGVHATGAKLAPNPPPPSRLGAELNEMKEIRKGGRKKEGPQDACGKGEVGNATEEHVGRGRCLDATDVPVPVVMICRRWYTSGPFGRPSLERHLPAPRLGEIGGDVAT